MMEWAYSGVNKTVPRNAGPECADFLNPTWRRIETVIVLTLATIIFKWSYKRITLPTSVYVRRDRGGRRALLVLMSLIWGMEIGYKFSSRTVIYLLNPCHVTTAIQVIGYFILFFLYEIPFQAKKSNCVIPCFFFIYARYMQSVLKEL